jgi:MGT family glycosyltransferase
VAHILYVSIGAGGHLIPSLAMVRELRTRGEQVTYLAPEMARPVIEPTGVRFHPYSSTILAERPRKLQGFDNPGVPLYVAREIQAAGDEIIDQVGRLRPDLVVYDGFTFTGYFAARVHGLPSVRVETSHLPIAAYNFYLEAIQGRLKGRLSSPETLAEFDRLVAPFYQRQRLPCWSFLDLVAHEAERTVVVMPPSLHRGSQGIDPRRVAFVGSSIDLATRPWEQVAVTLPPGGDPLVYVAFGSVFHYEPGFYHLCREALERLPVRGVLSVGDLMAEDIFEEVPPNLLVARRLPQCRLLDHASVCISHAGMGSTVEALARGVPLILVPQFPEQLATALRVEELRVGRYLDREEVSIASLRRLVREVLEHPVYRDNACRLAREIEQAGGYRRACDLIQAHLRSTATPGEEESPS